MQPFDIPHPEDSRSKAQRPRRVDVAMFVFLGRNWSTRGRPELCAARVRMASPVFLPVVQHCATFAEFARTAKLDRGLAQEKKRNARPVAFTT